MERKPRTAVVVGVGAIAGICVEGVVAFTTFLALGLWPEHWSNVVPQLLWGEFVGLPFGLAVGAAAGLFVSVQARKSESFALIVAKTVSLAIIAAVAVVEFLLT